MDRAIQKGDGARGMGRPRTFDLDDAIDRATDVFWSRGYEATSISDLKGALGIETGSLYKAFGSKHGLFLAALDRYIAADELSLQERLANGGREAVAAILRDTSAVACGAGHRGCFAINTAVELAPHDPEIKDRLARHEDRVTALFADALRADGDLAPDEVDSRAAFALSTLVALQVRGRRGASEEALRQTAERAVAAIT